VNRLTGSPVHRFTNVLVKSCCLKDEQSSA
jgi:hypothetical protein